MQVVRESSAHPTASEVYEAARAVLPSINYATVYNSLNFFKNAGLITEISFASGAEDWERDELIRNLVDALSQCDRDILDRMVYNFTQADADYGRRVAEGLGIPVASQTVESAGAA